MKLVNVLQRQRYKKEINEFIKQIAPELLAFEGKETLAFQKLCLMGAISKQEKVYFDMKLEAKIICLIIEHMYKEKGMEVFCAVNFIDFDYKSPGIIGKLIHLSGPHVPDEYVRVVDGYLIDPFKCPCGRAIILNEIVHTNNAPDDPISEDGLRNVFKKYHIQGVTSYPIHIDGEAIGTLTAMRCHDPVLEPEEARKFQEEIHERIMDMENVFTVLQEKWKNMNVTSWKYIVSGDGQLYYAEEPVEEVFGYNPSDLMGESFYEICHPDDKDKLRAVLKKVFENHKAKKVVVRFINPEGKYITTENLFVPVHDNGKLRYIEVFISVNTKGCQKFDRERKIKEAINYFTTMKSLCLPTAILPFLKYIDVPFI
ncbi:PAS domain-containing protein [Bacillus sp. MMSF_3328]|uniref:PAS domain-containing protein n=1 Tax=Bacillus sp. MMSF_3328 TaxID=3047080 RepID=UPI00273D57D2|nr:PAS domain-containing protein [Bacillus sp. MMSF_3328]